MSSRMRKITALLVGAVVVLGLLGVGRAVAGNNQNVQLAKGDTYNGLYIRSGEVVTIDGTVHGDAIVAGSNVTINGDVTGSVYAAGQNVTVRGTVGGNVHAAGSTVSIAGKVTGSLYAAGATVQVERDGSIGDGMVAAGQSVVVNGPVGAQVYAAGSTVNIDSSVGSDVTAAAGQVYLNNSAKVAGNLKYYSSNDAKINRADAVAGSINRQAPSKKPATTIFLARLSGALYKAVAFWLVGLVLLILAPSTTVTISSFISRRPWRSLGLGTAFVALVPIVGIIGLITVVGIPLVILAALGYIAALMIGSLFTALWFGRMILGQKDLNLSRNLGALAIGLIVLALLQVAPYIGGLITVVAFLIGVGALVDHVFARSRDLHQRQSGKKARA